ncbi:MAG TPA: YkgJ family cysteine cluster protein [Actinomycetota bacterium]|nr:YkgJ family cysteine cluster protein [Actinomycetota bacterium]
MREEDLTGKPDLAAGDFSTWVLEAQSTIRGEGMAEVPCGTCTACCTSSQFVHIAPDETDTLAHIPAELLFPAPRLPEGHSVLGFDERGHCPMLVEGKCSIYEHRPRTCRTYDCRVFTATGVEPDRSDIARQTRRWHFSYRTEADRTRLRALRAAASSLADPREVPPGETAPANATQRAVRAIEIHEIFFRRDSED